jgi:hypothetical protein
MCELRLSHHRPRRELRLSHHQPRTLAERMDDGDAKRAAREDQIFVAIYRARRVILRMARMLASRLSDPGCEAAPLTAGTTFIGGNGLYSPLVAGKHEARRHRLTARAYRAARQRRHLSPGVRSPASREHPFGATHPQCHVADNLTTPPAV